MREDFPESMRENLRRAMRQPTAEERQSMFEDVISGYPNWEAHVYGANTTEASGQVEEYDEAEKMTRIKVGVTYEDRRPSGCENSPHKHWKHATVAVTIHDSGECEADDGYPEDEPNRDYY